MAQRRLKIKTTHIRVSHTCGGWLLRNPFLATNAHKNVTIHKAKPWIIFLLFLSKNHHTHMSLRVIWRTYVAESSQKWQSLTCECLDQITMCAFTRSSTNCVKLLITIFKAAPKNIDLWEGGGICQRRRSIVWFKKIINIMSPNANDDALNVC